VLFFLVPFVPFVVRFWGSGQGSVSLRGSVVNGTGEADAEVRSAERIRIELAASVELTGIGIEEG
jgi:hypothetical protein